MKIFKDKTYSGERALYATENAVIENCRVEGEEDGESFLKESRDIEVKNCYMDLRYPLWHVRGLKLTGCEMTVNCRAALWYDCDAEISDCKMNGIKALRECERVSLSGVTANSPEFGWRLKDVRVKGGEINSEYAFFGSEKLFIENLAFGGKYSFQYVKNATIVNSSLKTKDAFWHSENVTVENCDIDGEYLGWYSDGLTLINCRIRGTQPLCYCKNLRLVNCTAEDCDLSFEYSEVEAEIRGAIKSVKNPLKGRITADGYGEIITDGAVYPCNAEITVRKK